MKTRQSILMTIAVLAALPSLAQQNYGLRFEQLNDPYVKDHMRLARHPEVGAGEFTVELWMQPDDSIPFCATEGNPQGCWSTGNTWFYGNFVFDGHNNFGLYPGRHSFDIVLANSGRVKVVLDPGGTETDGATDLVTGGQWRHLAVVREWVGATDHRVRIYVDGQLDGEQTFGGRPPLDLVFPYWGTERADWAGAGPSDFPDYHGSVDEIRYWSVARSQAELQQTMGRELAGNEPGLVHYLRLNEGQGALTNDMVADNDGIVFNLQPGTWVPSTAPIVSAAGPDCGDGVQNQTEQGVDCGGPCPPCAPQSETDCGNGLDDDFDGQVDCLDVDCAGQQLCNAISVTADDRDADHNPIEGVQLGNVYNRGQVCVGNDGERSWQLGLQFLLNVPVPVTITTARLELTSSGDNAGVTTTEIRAIDQDDVAPFVEGPGASFTSAYPLTSTAVGWTPEAAAASGSVTSPDLRALAQQVLDRPGWQTGNALGFVLSDNPTPVNWRCYVDFWAGGGAQARLALDYYTNGTPVCLDARGPADGFVVLREPVGGCPLSSSGPVRDFVFGSLSDVTVGSGEIRLDNLRCAADGALGTGEEVVTARDPDPLPGRVRIYLWRAGDAPDFGNGRLADGSQPPRTAAGGLPCP